MDYLLHLFLQAKVECGNSFARELDSSRGLLHGKWIQTLVEALIIATRVGSVLYNATLRHICVLQAWNQ